MISLGLFFQIFSQVTNQLNKVIEAINLNRVEPNFNISTDSNPDKQNDV